MFIRPLYKIQIYFADNFRKKQTIKDTKVILKTSEYFISILRGTWLRKSHNKSPDSRSQMNLNTRSDSKALLYRVTFASFMVFFTCFNFRIAEIHLQSEILFLLVNNFNRFNISSAYGFYHVDTARELHLFNILNINTLH